MEGTCAYEYKCLTNIILRHLGPKTKMKIKQVIASYKDPGCASASDKSNSTIVLSPVPEKKMIYNSFGAVSKGQNATTNI